MEKCDRPEMHCNQFTPDHCSQDSVRKECPFTCEDCKSSGMFHILSNIYTLMANILTSVIFDQYCIEFCFDSEGETTMPSVTSISNDTSSIQITYDQTCCKDKGVPEICMVLCTDSRFQERSLPPTPCDDHVEKIKKCLVPIKGNLFSSNKNISYAI